MIFGSNRENMRRRFFEAWRKYRANLPMEPLDAQIVQVIAIHPEYHDVVEDESNIERDYLPDGGETNPFLHMGMHLALRDQSMNNQPPGVRDLYFSLIQKFGGDHEAEHQMMECLGEMLWSAQRNGTEPDPDAYLECVRTRALATR